jgi:ATP-dependent 26S proteasome regulatory subunit
MTTGRRNRAEEKTPSPVEQTPTWVKVAAGVVGATSACLFISQMIRKQRPAKRTVPLQPARSKVTFAEVGGHEELKRQIERRIITPFREPSLFQRFKKRAGGGILMYGPPGCGKTLLARATAGQCNASFFNVAHQRRARHVAR